MSVVATILILIAGFVAIILLSELYTAIRKRLNSPKIGVEILLQLLKRDDYVCINGKVYQFSHFANANENIHILAIPSENNKTNGGELAFMNNHGLGYVYYYPFSMEKCDFIFGKYGLKWARNRTIANIAKEKIKKYHYE